MDNSVPSLAPATASNSIVQFTGRGQACATAEDEPSTFFELNGRNEVPFVEVWGWTNNNPISFPTLKENLCMKTVIYPDGDDKNLPHELEQLLPLAESLKTMDECTISKEYAPIHIPVLVQIIAKKKPDLILLPPRDSKNEVIDDGPRRAFVIGNLVVTDSSCGVCIVTLPNESVQIIHSKVEVGDFLIIQKATFKKCEKLKENFCYPYHDFLVGIEIKVEKYSVRNLHHIPFRSQPNWKPKIPDNLLPLNEAKLWTPKDFEACKEPPPVVYVDVIGVVNYVGRMERYRKFDAKVKLVEDVKDAGDQSKSVVGEKGIFWAYRWITLIDKESEELPLKLIINDDMNLQRSIVPGLPVIITNCKFEMETNSTFCVTPSVCTQIHFGSSIKAYLSIMPERYFTTARSEVLSAPSYAAILKRDNVSWGAGGVYSPKILNGASFYAGYKEWTERIDKNQHSRTNGFVPREYVFKRRERFTVTVRGKIIFVQEVLEKNCRYHMNPLPGSTLRPSLNAIVYGRVKDVEEMRKTGRNFSHHQICLCEGKCAAKHWFTFPRKLTMQIPNENTFTQESVRAVTNGVQEMCEPLLMPAAYPPMPSCEVPKLGKQPFMKPFDHFRIIIRDESTGDCYQTIWMTYSMPEMRSRYKEALDKVIIAEISIFYSEPTVKKEVVLCDFIIEEKFACDEIHASETSLDESSLISQNCDPQHPVVPISNGNEPMIMMGFNPPPPPASERAPLPPQESSQPPSTRRMDRGVCTDEPGPGPTKEDLLEIMSEHNESLDNLTIGSLFANPKFASTPLSNLARLLKNEESDPEDVRSSFSDSESSPRPSYEIIEPADIKMEVDTTENDYNDYDDYNEVMEDETNEDIKFVPAESPVQSRFSCNVV